MKAQQRIVNPLVNKPIIEKRISMEPPLRKVVSGLLLGLLFTSGWTWAQGPLSQPTVSAGQQQRLGLMKSKGVEASLTILPVRLGGRPFDRVTEVIGLLMEKQGLKNIELGENVFSPATRTDLQGLAADLGEFVEGHPVTTEYVMYAEINGSPETGPNELRAVVVDKESAVVWTDRQTPDDEAFKSLRSRDPMSLSGLLVQRLSPHFGLNEETAKAAKPGKMAAIMERRSGMPPENERAPLPARQKEMAQSRHGATLKVFPVRARGKENPGIAADLARMVNDEHLCKAVPAQEAIPVRASQTDPNELKVLWDLAREVRDYVRKNPADTDYVLYADYVFNPQQWKQGFVHFVVCDRKGEWVIVDMQNSHHPDYQSIKPDSEESCSRLLVKRLSGYLTAGEGSP